MFPFEPLEVYSLFDSVLPTSTGIYAIVNVLNGRFYIGSARATYKYPSKKGFRVRFSGGSGHRLQLTNNKHHSRHLQRCFNKTIKNNLDPNDVYQIWILDVLEASECLEVEDKYLKLYKPQYNSSLDARGGSKEPMSLETRAKISRGNKGKIISQESRKKQADTVRGVKKSKEHCRKISEAKKGKLLSDEHKAKITKTLYENPPRQSTYIGTSPSGEKVIFTNAAKFARENKQWNFRSLDISACANGRQQTHRGWKFSFYQEGKDDLIAS